jgi:hypothetical protein
MRGRIWDHVRSHVVGYVALFFALSGGAAWATHPGGANTISSGDIIDQAVRTEDIRDANLTTADIRTDAVISGKILDNTITPNDIDGVGFLRSRTVSLIPAGGSADETLLTIGRVNLVATCESAGSGNLRGMIQPGSQSELGFQGDGPMMVADGSQDVADDVLDLEPFDAQFLIILTTSTFAGEEKSFSFIDPNGTSASGVASVVVDPADGKCLMTVQAVG